jgi:hypothetical protein
MMKDVHPYARPVATEGFLGILVASAIKAVADRVHPDAWLLK